MSGCFGLIFPGFKMPVCEICATKPNAMEKKHQQQYVCPK